MSNILEEANNLVDGARRESYGTPLENHTRTAAMWSAYLGIAVSPRDVCMLNVLQKVSRDRHHAHRDSLIDIAGYARNAELCEEPHLTTIEKLAQHYFDRGDRVDSTGVAIE